MCATIQLYRYRFVILTILSLTSALTYVIGYQYVAVPTATARYYNVSSAEVYWTSNLYAVSSSLITLACSWIIDRKGIKIALVLATLSNFLGSAVKMGSMDCNRFYVVILGQAICSVSQSFVFALPSRVAREWFGAKEVSTASAFNVLALSVGMGIGLVIPTYVVEDSDDKEAIEKQFTTLQYGYLGISAAVLIVTIIGARNRPPTPPSVTTALRMECNHLGQNYFSRIKQLLKNTNFDFHLVAFGLNIGVDFVFMSVTTDVGLKFFPKNLQDFGWIGFWLNIVGCPAAVIAGYIMDRTRLYREGELLSYALMVVSFIVMEVMFYIVPSVYFLYIPALMIGIFMAVYMSIGFELGVELAYPEEESIVCGVLFTVAQVFVFILTLETTWLGERFADKKDLILFGSMATLLVLGLILQAFVKADYKRQLAEKTNSEKLSSQQTVSTLSQ